MSDITVGQALGGLIAAQRDLASVLTGVVTDAELLTVIAEVTRLESEIAALRIRAVDGVLQFRLCATEASLPIDASDDLRERRIARTVSRVTTDIALARQVPGHESGRQVRTAQRLCHRLPRTLAQVAAGGLTETRARIIADAVDKLPEQVVAEYDELAARDCLGKGDKGVRGAVRGLTYRLDPCGTIARNRKAVSERYGSSRPVADGMAQFSVMAPLAQVVAAYSSLASHAEECRLRGDTRSKAQIIADTAIARLTCGAVQGCDADGGALRWSAPTVPCPTILETSPTVVKMPDTESVRARRGLVVVFDARAGAAVAATVEESHAAGQDDGSAAGVGDGRESRDTGDPWSTQTRGDDVDDGEPTFGPGGPDDHLLPALAGDDVDDGEPSFGPGPAAAPRLHLHLILTDRTLLGGDEPALLAGHGPVPAFVARQLAGMSAAAAEDARGVIRRYLTDPVSGRLAECDPRVRVFPRVMKDFLLVRDQVCRTPYCDAAIREFDHVAPYAQGGATTIDNGQGLCLRCNRAKETAGWHQTVGTAGIITTATTTGAVAHSPEPELLGWRLS